MTSLLILTMNRNTGPQRMPTVVDHKNHPSQSTIDQTGTGLVCEIRPPRSTNPIYDTFFQITFMGFTHFNKNTTR